MVAQEVAGGALVDFDHGAAVEAVILGGVAEAADASFGEAVDLRGAVVVAVARGGVVHEEFFAVDEAELVAVACGEDFIEGDVVVDGARVGGIILGGGDGAGAVVVGAESHASVVARVAVAVAATVFDVAVLHVGADIGAALVSSEAASVGDGDGG